MTFGISATGWAAITAVTAIASAASSNHQQKKAAGLQGKAVREAQEADAKEAAAAELNAATTANQSLAEKARRRRASALSAGDPLPLLGPTSVLGASTATPVATQPATSALGAGKQ